MIERISLSQMGITRRNFFTVFILVLNIFVWLDMSIIALNSILSNPNFVASERATIWTFYYIAAIGSSLLGAVLAPKIGRLRFLYLWMILGVASSLMLAIFSVDTITESIGVSFLLAVSFGLGMPSCMSYFSDCTSVENRGRLSGIIYFAIFLSIFVSTMYRLSLNLTWQSITSAIWRASGLILFFWLKPREEVNDMKRKYVGYRSIMYNRSYILYFIPWIMFSLVNGLDAPTLQKTFGSSFYGLTVLSFIVSSFSSFIAGFMSDFIGRKRVTLYGFVTLGLAYALLGFAPYWWVSWYFFAIIDGIAWGIFSVIFILILWGELPLNIAKEKSYAIGGIPFTIGYMIQTLQFPYISIDPYAAFSFASFFLFLAVLPLMYAPETLPEKKMEIRRLKGYIEQAKKFTEKYTKKNVNKN